MNFELYFKNRYKDKIDEYMYEYIHREDFETSIKKLYIENEQEMTLYVYATIYVDYYEYQDIENKKCLTIKCFVDLENENNFEVIEIVEYEKPIIKIYTLDSQSLLPYIPNDKYDELANEIINHYFTKTELCNYIDAKTLAKRMKLNIQYHKLSSDGKVFGLTCFKDCNIYVYDNNIKKEINVQRGTIIVDREILSEYGGFSSENFTIIHECVHWYVHRKYFFFEYNLSKYVSCRDDGIISTIETYNDDYVKMEYQANGISARILLPYIKIKNDFNNLYDLLSVTNNKRQAYIKCIDSISNKSHVSREAVKIRLKEIGYKVEGIYEFVDGKYLKPYLHDNNYDFDESYSITELELLKLLLLNEKFSIFSKNNNLVFVDNHLCINNKKYITPNYELTDYALDHINECCVLFKYKTLNKKKCNTGKYLLFRANSKGREFFVEEFKSPVTIIHNDDVSIIKEYEKSKVLLERIYNMDIQSALRECREALQISQRQLADYSNYSEQTIKNIETKPNRDISIENILRLSLGMKLSKDVIYRLLEIGNHSLLNEMSQLDALYRYILDYMSRDSVERIDKFLMKYNQKPLFYDKSAYEE